MSSWQSRIFLFALRHRHLLRLQLTRRRTVDWNTSIPQLRAEVEKGAKLFGRLQRDIVVTPIEGDHFSAEWLHPRQISSDRSILYFHGGGYVAGSASSHRAIVSKFIRASGAAALVIDYRLAPEHPYPAALEDAVAAYRWMLTNGKSPSRIVLAGDSAGGGLCLATLLVIRDLGLPLPAGAVVLSPWTDLKCTGESLRDNADIDPLTWPDSWIIFSKYYAGEHDPSDPRISPLYGDLRGLPPLLIFVGGHEVLRDDSIRFAEKAEEAGVDVTLRVGGGLFHCYPVCSPLFTEARMAMAEIGRFIRANEEP